MAESTNWFDVDREGLKKQVQGRPKSFVLYELLQNCWDEKVKLVQASMRYEVDGQPLARICVMDDNPEGFKDLSHAYTVFANSAKKTDATKRGRFNLGEKLVLAMCYRAKVQSTTGSVYFQENGIRKEVLEERTQSGSHFVADIPMTREEFDQMCEDVHKLIPPEGVETFVNDCLLRPNSEPVITFQTSLQTVISDGEGVMRPTTRRTEVQLYQVFPGETATIYEMGIPVVAAECKWHVNVMQKVPLNFERDNVTPSYLRSLRVAIVNAAYGQLSREECAALWVRDACKDDRIKDSAVKTVITNRFGRAVSADPNDIEAMHTAVGEGFSVISGGMLTKEEWAIVRRAEALRPAGKVFPTPKPYSDDPDADPVEVIPEEKQTLAMKGLVEFTKEMARELMGVNLTVTLVKTPNKFLACYGKRDDNKSAMDYNVKRLGMKWVKEWTDHLDDVLDLIVHEFGHQFGSNHLSEEYHKGLTKLAGRLAYLALSKPHLFPKGSVVMRKPQDWRD